MTISTTSTRNTYTGNGSTVVFPYGYRILNAADLTVTKRLSGSLVESTLNYPADYTVSGVGNVNGGSITLMAAPATGDTIVIRREMTRTQGTSIRNQGSYFPETHETVFDRLTMYDQEQDDELARTFKLPSTVDPSTFDMELPKPVAGQVLTWGPTGLTNGTVSSSSVVLPGQGRDTTTLTQYLSNNYVYNVLDYDADPTGVVDSTTAIQAAIAACVAAGGGPVFFPPGVYLVSALITVGTKVTLVGTKASRLFLKASTTLAQAITGVPAIIYLQGQYSAVIDLTIDGNKGSNTQQIVGALMTGNDTLLLRVEGQNCAGDVSFGSALRAQGAQRPWIVHCYAHDNNSDGVNVFGNCIDARVDHLLSVNNGIGGLEIEGDGTQGNAPVNTTITSYTGWGNVANNLNIKAAAGVRAYGVSCRLGGNNGSVKIINSVDVNITDLYINGAAATAVAPHGLWIHRETDGVFYNFGSQHVKIVGAHCINMPDGTANGGVKGDGIRITDSSVDVEFVAPVSTLNAGFGLNIDNTTVAPSGTSTRMPDYVHLIGGYVQGNTTGQIGGNFAGIANRMLLGVGGFINFINASLGLSSGSHLEIAGAQVVQGRIAGWADPTGTLSRATFDQSTVTLPQLAQRVAQLVLDLKTHGLIGT